MAESNQKVLCANCDGPIGRLEDPVMWKGERVCRRCYLVLSGDSPLEDRSPELTHSKPASAVQTIELTGKRWKGLGAIGFLIFWAGLGLGLFVHLGFLLLIPVAMLILFVTDIGTWWYHK